MVTILQGDVLTKLRELRANGTKVKCVVTSPPYWGLRDYGLPPSIWGGNPRCDHVWGAEQRHSGGAGRQGKTSQRVGRANVKAQEAARAAGAFCHYCGAWRGCHGLEPTPELFVEHEVEIFALLWDVLEDDGTLWLNLGDSYNDSGKDGGTRVYKENGQLSYRGAQLGKQRNRDPELKSKDIVGIPWRVALALQASGWYLRADIIWHKPNPMPESVRDRPTKAHEYLFLLTKSERYYYDAEAIKEKSSPESHARYARGRSDNHKYADGGPQMQTIARSFEHMAKKQPAAGVHPKSAPANSRIKANESFMAAVKDLVDTRNKRSVWTVPTYSYKGAHFATFPPDLIRPCILAGCPKGGTVLDIFGGSGTTGQVAEEEGRNSILIELNPEYVGLAEQRTAQAGLLHST